MSLAFVCVCVCVCVCVTLSVTQKWVECVGIADRSCYDLSNHQRVSRTELVAREEFAQPISCDCFYASFLSPLL
ncbi:MAG: hypothetical protein ACK41O_26690, partial [Runella zeae]